MACLGSLNSPMKVYPLSKFCGMPRSTTHGKFYQQQALSLRDSHTSTKPTTENQCDIIGPPDPVTNLRPINFHVPQNESPIEKKFRLKRQDIQQWNHDFWTSHNSKFVKERKEFIAANQPKNSEPMSADEMSVFYKAFLDKNWRTHLDYNVEWYKKNALLVLMHIQVKLSRLKTRLLKEN